MELLYVLDSRASPSPLHPPHLPSNDSQQDFVGLHSTNPAVSIYCFVGEFINPDSSPNTMRFEPYCRVCRKETHCCVFTKNRGFTFIGINDAKRIKKYTGKEFDSFLDFSSLPKKLVTELKQEDPLLEGGLRYTQLDKQYRILRLKKQQNGDCIFLTNSKRCEIYKIRPNICKMYPFWGVRLLDKSIKIVGHDEPTTCPATRSGDKLTAQQIKELVCIFKKIEQETEHYTQHIELFFKQEFS